MGVSLHSRGVAHMCVDSCVRSLMCAVALSSLMMTVHSYERTRTRVNAIMSERTDVLTPTSEQKHSYEFSNTHMRVGLISVWPKKSQQSY